MTPPAAHQLVIHQHACYAAQFWGLASIRGLDTWLIDRRCCCSGAVPLLSGTRRLLETSEWTTLDLLMQEAPVCPAPLIKNIPEKYVSKHICIAMLESVDLS